MPANRPFLSAVLRDPDSNPYSLLENTEAEQAGDTDASESQPLSNRRRRSRRRRTDDDTTVMDGALESDSTSVNENGTGERGGGASFPHPHAPPRRRRRRKTPWLAFWAWGSSLGPPRLTMAPTALSARNIPSL